MSILPVVVGALRTSVSILPVVVGALGIVKEGQTDIVKRIPGNCSIFDIQKSVLLGSMAILKKIFKY